MAKHVLKNVAGYNPDAKHKLVTIRFTQEELEALKAKAEKWTYGNMTAIVKYAVACFEPKKGDLVEVAGAAAE